MVYIIWQIRWARTERFFLSLTILSYLIFFFFADSVIENTRKKNAHRIVNVRPKLTHFWQCLGCASPPRNISLFSFFFFFFLTCCRTGFFFSGTIVVIKRNRTNTTMEITNVFICYIQDKSILNRLWLMDMVKGFRG